MKGVCADEPTTVSPAGDARPLCTGYWRFGFQRTPTRSIPKRRIYPDFRPLRRSFGRDDDRYRGDRRGCQQKGQGGCEEFHDYAQENWMAIGNQGLTAELSSCSILSPSTVEYLASLQKYNVTTLADYAPNSQHRIAHQVPAHTPNPTN